MRALARLATATLLIAASVEAVIDQAQAVEPRAVEPRAVEPRAVEPRAVEPRAVDGRAVDGRAEHPAAPSLVRTRWVGEGCRVRQSGPIACAAVPSITIVRGETASVQILLETTGPARRIDLVLDAEAPLDVRARREIFLPVVARSRGRDADGEALPWSAAARPPDDEALGSVADPLIADLSPQALAPRPGARTAVWLDVGAARGARAGSYRIHFGVGVATQSLPVQILDADLPSIPVSSFAYVELDELAAMPDPEAARRLAYEMLEAHHVTPVGRVIDDRDVRRDAMTMGDFAVLGAYGTLGDPTPQALARVESMVRALPARVRHVVLYAVDESCGSSLPDAWRAALASSREPIVHRVKVLATCDRPMPGADVTMVQSSAFSPALAASVRARGDDLWVYNGRLPHAGPMALDAPPESLLWNGWIAARYDVGRWFYWNTNHWSDRNRGGWGPRDLYESTETFHNDDGDVVLEDGILLYPAYQRHGFASVAGHPDNASPTRPDPILGSVRLARLRRGAEDAALLALAFRADPDLARSVLGRIVPRALGDIGASAPPALGRADAIVAARAELHGAIARAAREDRLSPGPSGARADLAELRATTPPVASPTGAPAILLGAGAMVVGLALALAIEALRRRRRG